MSHEGYGSTVALLDLAGLSMTSRSRLSSPFLDCVFLTVKAEPESATQTMKSHLKLLLRHVHALAFH